MGKLSKIKKIFFLGIFATAAGETWYLLKRNAKKMQSKVEELKTNYENYGKEPNKNTAKKTTKKKNKSKK